ncbi:MAG: type II toxin-antitoxin system prevent-host-death family antitoxin [Candidatus Dormiibacterota bacterium]
MGVRELRQNASGLLRRVKSGEVIDVTEHGRPIARLVPFRPGLLDQLVLEGRATEAEGDLLDAMHELGLPAPSKPGQIPVSQALAELRADER